MINLGLLGYIVRESYLGRVETSLDLEKISLGLETPMCRVTLDGVSVTS